MMTISPCPVYVFRSEGFAPAGDTVVSVAPLDFVSSVYGRNGLAGEEGLAAVFGGGAVFKNHASGERFVGVWGARNASRFRSTLRVYFQITIHKHPPDARLSVWSTKRERPKRDKRV